MYALIKQHHLALEELCRRHAVKRLDLFGSAARDDFDAKESDLDFLVEFQDLAPAAYAASYFGLLEGLKSLFNRDVDLVTESSITNPYFRESIEQTRLQLYAA